VSTYQTGPVMAKSSELVTADMATSFFRLTSRDVVEIKTACFGSDKHYTYSLRTGVDPY
jgi:hypothetical protein